MKRICIVYIKAGSGHYAAAQALKACCEVRADVTVELLDIRTILNEVDPISKLFHFNVEGIYDWQLRNGMMCGQRPMLRIAQWFIRHKYEQMHEALENYFRPRMFTSIVSVMPNFNRVIEDAARSMKIPSYIVMTDFEDAYAPHFWWEPGTSSTLIAPTERAYQQARAIRDSTHVVKVSGCIVHPKFYNNIPRGEFHFACQPVGLVMYGGNGSEQMVTLARRLQGADIPLIFVCGKNNKLADRIKSIISNNDPWTVIGFTNEMECLMKQAHYFIGKPGPGAISEALVSGLPLLLDDAGVMRQERYNVAFVLNSHFGSKLTVRGWDRLNYAEFLNDFWNHIPYRKNVINEYYENKAVYEIREMLT